MIRRFLRDKRGNYMILTAASLVPIMGGLALAVDYSEMARQRQETLNALDAAGIATAKRVVEGATDEQLKAYAKDFFETNLGSVKPSDTVLTVLLPKNNAGGGTLKLTAELKYKPYFFPTFTSMIGKDSQAASKLDFQATSEVRLKNTLEVALVLDNSGSMDDIGTGSGKKRMVLLKEAAKQLVDTIAGQAQQMKQVAKPVQFGVVPFAASVNIGPDMATKSWMDTDGISPVHHENFDWSSFPSANKKIQKISGIYYKKGTDWGAEDGTKVTRFTMFNDIKRITGYHQEQTGTKEQCTGSGKNKKCTIVPVYTDFPDYGTYASWQGCVESRPYPYNVNDAVASTSTPETLFVPMFGPDETDRKDSSNRSAENNWWADLTTSTDNLVRQKFWQKYFTPAPEGTAAAAAGAGPNASCTTKPITPLTDVSDATGVNVIKTAIDAMASLGATNVPEGMAWGWRVVSNAAPFTDGRPETEKGNDKVVIVLTDGANTYYTPSSLGYNDLAGSKSTYSSYGYLLPGYNGTSTGRLFMGTSGTFNKADYSNANYTKALNEQFTTLCNNAKTAGVLVMTVSLDLSSSNTTEKAQMDALKACSSDSRFRKDPTNPSKPAKLYWNATGGNLADKFKEIADELSNLRIVG